MIRIACSDSEASCLIASLITEIAMPCPCEGGPLRICGTGPDGAPAEVRILGGSAYYGIVGVLPLRWIYRDRVARAAKAEAHHQRKAYPIQRKEDKHIAPTPGTTQLRGAGLPAVLHHYGQRLRKNM